MFLKIIHSLNSLIVYSVQVILQTLRNHEMGKMFLITYFPIILKKKKKSYRISKESRFLIPKFA